MFGGTCDCCAKLVLLLLFFCFLRLTRKVKFWPSGAEDAKVDGNGDHGAEGYITDYRQR